jgi:hypothetical protein
MNGGFGRRKSEDQPAVPRIDRVPPERVAQERAIGGRVLAVHNQMRPRRSSMKLFIAGQLNLESLQRFRRE